MKLTICDPCKKNDNKITETNRVLRVRNKSFLNIDVCEDHAAELKKISMLDYVRYVFKLRGLEVNETDAELKLKYLS